MQKDPAITSTIKWQIDQLILLKNNKYKKEGRVEGCIKCFLVQIARNEFRFYLGKTIASVT